MNTKDKSTELAPTTDTASGFNSGLDSPYFPNEIYDNLPKLLIEAVNPIKGKGRREKDVLLLSAVGVMSGMFPNVEGIYHGRPLSPHFNVFIIAPPASGKGVMTFTKMLGDQVDEKLKKASREKEAEYLVAKAKYQSKLKDGKSDAKPPQKPEFKLLYIPGDVSSAAVIQHLVNNDGSAIIIEAEADTISNTLKLEWGSFSHLIRKSFHHETVSSSRKGKVDAVIAESFHEVQRPKLAIIVSGTPGQTFGLINNAEDGMFSRFSYYTYRKDRKWNNAFDNVDENLEDRYKKLGKQVLDIHSKYSQTHSFKLTKPQREKFDKRMTEILEGEVDKDDDSMASAITRLGIVAFRIAMVLTIIRHFENKDKTKQITCLDKDFQTAMSIMEVLIEHSSIVADRLTDNSSKSKLGHRKELFDALPEVGFTTTDARLIALDFGISGRTLGRRLTEFVKWGLLRKLKRGNYVKR